MNVLIACEYSATIREAFRKKGHNAWSCDLLPSDVPGNHYQCDVRQILYNGWDMMIGCPPCTFLTVSGAWCFDNPRFPKRRKQQEEALHFFLDLLEAPIPRIAIENPIGVANTKIRPPDQIIDPFEFGHAQTKKTCLWLKNLPLLQPIDPLKAPVLERPDWKRLSFARAMPPSADRQKKRSKFFENIAYAMAEQWGSLPKSQGGQTNNPGGS